MQRNRRAARASSLVLAAALGLVGCGGDGGSPVDSMQHVSLLPTYAQIEEATGALVVPESLDVGQWAIMRRGSYFPLCQPLGLVTSSAMILGPAFPLPDGVDPRDAPGNTGAAIQLALQNHEGGDSFVGYLFIVVAKGDSFIPTWSEHYYSSEVNSFVEVTAGYPQADPLAFELAGASLGEAQGMVEEVFDQDQLGLNKGPCSGWGIVSEVIDDLPVGVVGYRDREIDRGGSFDSLPLETPFVDAIMSRFGQTLYASIGGDWSVMVSIWGGDFYGLIDADAAAAAEVLFALDLVPVLEETVRLVEEHGPEVLKAKRAPSAEEALKYLKAGWNEGTP